MMRKVTHIALQESLAAVIWGYMKSKLIFVPVYIITWSTFVPCVEVMFVVILKKKVIVHDSKMQADVCHTVCHVANTADV